mmetsp:Transcript_22241/g.33092  ORF Transcript_22241/g.33092 Transcript_22241/m.33092 type:complete len:211 (-) Transcript_22241:1792-2424(-)
MPSNCFELSCTTGIHPTSFSSRSASASEKVMLAGMVVTCCFIHPFKALPSFRSLLTFCPSSVMVSFFDARFASCRSRFCSLFHNRCLAAATSLYVTRPITSFCSSTTGKARTSYLVNKSSTSFSVICGSADSTGAVMISPTHVCFDRPSSIKSSTMLFIIPSASAGSANRTVADAALGCPPPPNFSIILFSLTAFKLTPGLARPIIIMVD